MLEGLYRFFYRLFLCGFLIDSLDQGVLLLVLPAQLDHDGLGRLFHRHNFLHQLLSTQLLRFLLRRAPFRPIGGVFGEELFSFRRFIWRCFYQSGPLLCFNGWCRGYQLREPLRHYAPGLLTIHHHCHLHSVVGFLAVAIAIRPSLELFGLA
mgnify:CR=1 FL=1